MITMIIGAPNFFTELFNYKILKYVGRFSFGIYLLHPMCIVYARELCERLRCKAIFECIMYAFILSYLTGFLFLYLIENLLMKLSKFCCNQLAKLKYFNNDNLSVL